MIDKIFKPFESKVLVRNFLDEPWVADIFSNYYDEGKTLSPYITIGGKHWNYCIPFEGNEKLLGTTDREDGRYMPKDGDFVIIKEILNPKELKAIFFYDVFFEIATYALINKYGKLFTYHKVIGEAVRPATEEEKQEILDALHKENKEWDAEKKAIRTYEWIPKLDEVYFRPEYNRDLTYSVKSFKWKDEKFENIFLDKGWIFKTKEECQLFCDKLNKTIGNVKL